MSFFQFQLEASDPSSQARAGQLSTPHGIVQTPAFMPVGTLATVKNQSFETLRDLGAPVLLANTYHLSLRPGPEVFEKLGGIHRFMSWDRPVLTDSGGFQVFSLSHQHELSEEGVLFESYLDQKKILLTPEKSISIQQSIGSDIMMVLDVCTASTVSHSESREAMERTHRWALRSLQAKLSRPEKKQALFAIVQGAIYDDLRTESAGFLTQHPFDGFAIGGLAVGEPRIHRESVTSHVTRQLPKNKPRYLMGVGTPIDLLEGVAGGVDMFDCILPTSLAQRGVVFTSRGRLELRRAVYKLADEPLDPSCPCTTCLRYSKAYLHHLVRCEEALGWQLLGTHNLSFYLRLMNRIRNSIIAGAFQDLYRAEKPILESRDLDRPIHAPKARGQVLKLGEFQISKNLYGHSTIQHISSKEKMHPDRSPTENAFECFLRPSNLKALLEQNSSKEVTLWDVGLGMATNAMAAIATWESIARSGTTPAPLHLISFEKDSDSLQLALEHAKEFPHLSHEAPKVLLQNRFWKSKSGDLKWTLILGDFLEGVGQAPLPDIIFYDPFSIKVNRELWGSQVFELIRRHCGSKDFTLVTHSTSNSVRSALLANGLYVSSGLPGENSNEITIATSKMPGQVYQLLGPDWLNLWNGKQEPFPIDLPEQQRLQFKTIIFNHRQFKCQNT